MAQLVFSEQEAELLLHILENHRSDLRMEIADTDRKAFRDQLKANEALLLQLIEKLQHATDVAGQ